MKTIRSNKASIEERRSRVLSFIGASKEVLGQYPSCRDIAAKFETSATTASGDINALVASGKLAKKQPNSRRYHLPVESNDQEPLRDPETETRLPVFNFTPDLAETLRPAPCKVIATIKTLQEQIKSARDTMRSIDSGGAKAVAVQGYIDVLIDELVELQIP